MLGIIGLVIAYLGAAWVTVTALKYANGDGRIKIISIMGFSSAIYATLAYLMGYNVMPDKYLNISVLMISIASIGANIGRVLADPPLIKEVMKDKNNNGIATVMNAVMENGAIFSLLVFLLGYLAFKNNDWTSLITSPEAFLMGMEIMGLASLLGGMAVGWVIKATLQRLEEEGIDLQQKGFQKLMIYSAFPQTIIVFGLLLTLLVFMGAI